VVEPTSFDPVHYFAAGSASATHAELARIIALSSPTLALTGDPIRLSQSSPRTVRMVLSALEIAGRIERHGGGLVSLI
jgi:DNA processing protein